MLRTKDGQEYLGWLDEKGTPAAALLVKTIERGVGDTVNFEAIRYSGGILFRRHGATLTPIAGKIDAVTPGGAEAGQEVDVYEGITLRLPEARMLAFLGVGIAGRAGRVKATHGGRVVEAELSNKGRLSISNAKFWEPRDR